VSVDALGGQGNAPSGTFGVSISGNGRFVAFTSFASNLVPGDTNSLMDIFVHDRFTGATVLASVDSLGAQTNRISTHPSISADGRLVAFDSWASNLVAGDTNELSDVFVHDFGTGGTIRASVGSTGAEAIGRSEFPALSGDGRYVAYESNATNLVPGDVNFMRDVYVHELASGITTRVSLSSAGVQGNDHSWDASISRDGRFVAFSSGNRLVSGDTRNYDVFVRDRQLGTTTRASVDSHGAQASNDSFSPSISPDGRRVAFDSGAANLVPTDTNGFIDVFVRVLRPSHRF
jgi:Tol biopolymer transport system component